MPTLLPQAPPDIIIGTDPISAYMRGYVDGVASVPPAVIPPVVPVVPVVPPANVVAPGTDLATLETQAAQPGYTIQLGDGDYVLSRGMAWIGTGGKLIGTGKSRIVRQVIDSSTSGIRITGAGFEAYGIIADSNAPLFDATGNVYTKNGPASPGRSPWSVAKPGEPTADFKSNVKVGVNFFRLQAPNAYIHDCEGHNLDDLVMVDRGGSSFRLENLHCFKGTRGDGIFVGDDNGTVTNCTIDDSEQEHPFRMNSIGSNPYPQNTKVTNNFFGKPASGKESVALRDGDGTVFTGNTLYWWMRLGEGRSDVPVASNCMISGNFFMFSRPATGPDAGAQLDIMAGVVNVTITGNIFLHDGTGVPVSIQAGTTGHFGPQTLQLTALGVTAKDVWHVFPAVDPVSGLPNKLPGLTDDKQVSIAPPSLTQSMHPAAAVKTTATKPVK